MELKHIRTKKEYHAALTDTQNPGIAPVAAVKGGNDQGTFVAQELDENQQTKDLIAEIEIAGIPATADTDSGNPPGCRWPVLPQ